MKKSSTTGHNPADTLDTWQALLDAARRFRDARNWSQFHTPKNLAAAIAIEAAEL